MLENINSLMANFLFSILGIFVMNSVVHGLPFSAYFNPSSAGTSNMFDWTAVFLSELFIAQKMMGIFSILFGASIVLFIESAQKKGKDAKKLSLWRNFLLFCFGSIHMLFWEGDVLVFYALCAPIIILTYNKKIKFLFVLGLVITLFPIFLSIFFQSAYDPITGKNILATEGEDIGLGKFWFADSDEYGSASLVFLFGGFCRALGMMFIGVVLYRKFILNGNLESKIYKKMIFYGFSLGILLTLLSLIWYVSKDYSPSIALIGYIPSTIGMVPMVIGYIGLFSLLNRCLPQSILVYFSACGKMAFTNYITQTIFGILIFNLIFSKGTLGRAEIMVFVFVVWIIQILWSKYWLDNYKYGPLELIWRKLTYIF